MASARPSAAASDVFPGAPHRRGAARIKSSLDRWPTPIRPAQSKGKSMTVNIRNWQELKKPSNLEIKARSEEHTSELQSLMRNSYAVFCLKKKQQLHKVRPLHQKTDPSHRGVDNA